MTTINGFEIIGISVNITNQNNQLIYKAMKAQRLKFI
jgi:hypothetical protein